MRATRPRHSQLKEEARKKANARAYTHEYIKRGKIIKLPCCICGNNKVEAHHEDYNKPLEIIWYCRRHHLEYHERNKELLKYETYIRKIAVWNNTKCEII